MPQATIDIELALREAGELSPGERSWLKSNFATEDRQETGWGLVLRLDSVEVRSLAEQLGLFVKKSEGMEAVIAKCKPVLRIAMFSPNAAPTIWLDNLTELERMGVSLELSFYPVESDE